MNTQMPSNAAEAVANGAQWLDDMHPGWWREINLDALNLADCKRCVCGQLARTWYANEEGQRGYRVILQEYDLVRGFDSCFPDWCYEDLDEEWHKVITARLEADVYVPAHAEPEVALVV